MVLSAPNLLINLRGTDIFKILRFPIHKYGLSPSVLVCYCCCSKLPQIEHLKTTQIYYLTFYRSKVRQKPHQAKNQDVRRAVFLFWRSKEEYVSLPFLASWVDIIPLLLALFSFFKPSNFVSLQLFFHLHLSPYDPHWERLSPIKDSCD